MATSTQTDELERYLSSNDLPALMSEVCPISPSHILEFGVQLQISGSKIEELRMHLHTYKNKVYVLKEVLKEALKCQPPLTRREIITALQHPSVEENRLASQIRSQYRPPSQRDSQAPQTALFQQMPTYQLSHLTQPHATSGNLPQTLSNIQPALQPNTSRLFTSEQLNPQLLRPDQHQPSLDQVDQSHQLQTLQRTSMPPPPALVLQRTPQMQHWTKLHHQLPPSMPPHPSSQLFSSQYSLPSHGISSFQPSQYPLCQKDQGHQNQQSLWQRSPSRSSSPDTGYSSDSDLSPIQEARSEFSPPPTPDVTLSPVPSPSHSQQPFSLSLTPVPSTGSPITDIVPPLVKKPRLQYPATPDFTLSPVPSPSHGQQYFPLSSQHLTPIPSRGSPITDIVPPLVKKLRLQYPSPSCLFSSAGKASIATVSHPPLVHDFISFVKKMYSAQNVLRDEKWSLSPTVKFINLACIDRKCVKSKEYNDVTKAMVMDGNVDAIEETKGPIKFSEIAKGISLPSRQGDDRRLILVEGAPGVGKSTFAWEFCRRWMNGETAQQYHLVFLLRLRDDRIRSAKCVKDLFFHPSAEVSAAVYQELLTSHTFHALIILEGYDELPYSCRNDPSSVFNELISGDSLPLATVLVTSRPWATKDLHEKHACHIYQHIEILGFTKKQIKEYINKSISGDKMRSGLNSYLERHPQIKSGMYIPLNSAIVVAVYKDNIENDRQNLPNTITELYSCCVEILIRRHLKRNTGQQGGNELNLPAINLRLPSDVHRNFVHMCHLAFSGIVEATEVKLILSESELPEHFDNLGFMDSVTDLYVTGETVSSHNFLHITFQEFFAAVHISTMSKEQQLQYFREGKGIRLKIVLKFLAGLQKLDCFTKDTASHIVTPASSVSSYLTPVDITVDVDVINWLFEAQSETAMLLILGERKVEFKASKRHMSPMDYYSLGYCISHSQCQWVLSLTGTLEISKEKIIMLAEGARELSGAGKVVELGNEVLLHLSEEKLNLLFTEWNNILYLQKLCIHQSVISDDGAMSLVKAVHQNSNIHTLSLMWNEISDEGALALADVLHHNSTLQLLDLNNNSIGDKGVVALAKALRHNSTLQLLNIYCNNIGDKGAVVLAGALHHNSVLQSLYLSNNSIGDEGAVALADALHHNTGLQSLYLSNNSIGETGAVALAEALRHNSTFQLMELSYNSIGDDGAVALAYALHHNTGLQSLYLVHNSIGYTGAVALAEALHHNSTFRLVKLGYNSIGYKGAVALAEGLHHNHTFFSLDLNNSSIGDEGAVALAKALHQNSIFQSLNLDNNGIGNVGATAIAQSVYHNSTLKHLSLGGNIIGNSGAVALAESLHQNTTLQILLLSGNHISCDILTTSPQSLPVPEHITITSIVRVTNKGIRFMDTFNDFVLDIPDGAIPDEEVTLTIYMGVTLFGPYQFPEGLRPISPVFWVCVREQKNFHFSKPVTVTIPHFLDLDNYAFVQSLGLTFLKAGHIMNTDKMYEFQCTNGGKQFSKTHGFFTTSYFCSLCIAAKDIPRTENETPFCLTIAIPKFTIPVGKSVYAYFFITFLRLKTCLMAVDSLIEKMGLKSFRIQKKQFRFESKDKNPALQIACTNSEHGKIRVTGITEVCSINKLF